ncbi:MAG: repeat-containing protein [Planctomycetaceae bacterium]|nr:repeat-containing protein [Planctomycetaceae bacterium]
MEQIATKSNSRRWVIVVACFAAVAAIVAVVFDPTQVVIGTLSGDVFFQGRPARYWSRMLGAGPAERATAEDQLQQGGANSVPVLAAILRTDFSKNAEPRWVAAEMLTKMGPEASAAGPAMMSALRDSDPHLQAVCAASLPKIKVPAESAVPLLTEFLKTKHTVIVARALSEYRGAASSALPELIKLLEDKSQSTEVRWSAARTIGKIGPASLSAVPVLIAHINDEAPTIREHCAEAIGDIGPTAVEGVPALIVALKDVDQRVRRDAVRSLGYIGPEARTALPEIKKLLKDPVQRVKDATLTALKAIAPDEAAAVEKQLGTDKAKSAPAKSPAD